MDVAVFSCKIRSDNDYILQDPLNFHKILRQNKTIFNNEHKKNKINCILQKLYGVIKEKSDWFLRQPLTFPQYLQVPNQQRQDQDGTKTISHTLGT
jgi:hypothetical protein